jgi:hypothetical protein
LAFLAFISVTIITLIVASYHWELKLIEQQRRTMSIGARVHQSVQAHLKRIEYITEKLPLHQARAVRQAMNLLAREVVSIMQQPRTNAVNRVPEPVIIGEGLNPKGPHKL